ncbi:MAG: heat-inducible transcription repressor HrcA [Tissierellia bacterium]|nr:heat-inducible transcription repressor HrcA [Tissierellia bacterium]
MLDERKLKILYAIINSYILSAEPIGSRTITKQYDLGISSATVRNEMSDLEDLGYLNKPHSSAGRVPSDKAYRLYVDQLLKMIKPKIDYDRKEEIKKALLKEAREIDQLLQNSAKILSAITSYTALAVSPKMMGARIKLIQLVPIDEFQVLLTIVSDTGVVKNSIFRLDIGVYEDQINTISNMLNHKLKGLPIDKVNDDLANEIMMEIYEYKNVIDEIIPIISKSLEDVQDVDIYADGITKILDLPEYKDLEKAKTFISFIEDKDTIIELLLNNSLTQDIEISIGSENIYDPIKDCSLITANYRLGDRVVGKVGVIGPTRMDYYNVIKNLYLVSLNISEIIDMLLGRRDSI